MEYICSIRTAKKCFLPGKVYYNNENVADTVWRHFSDNKKKKKYKASTQYKATFLKQNFGKKLNASSGAQR